MSDMHVINSLSLSGVKQGCPLSPTIFSLCVDELEQMIVKFVKEEGIEEVAIQNVVIMCLLYVDDVGVKAWSGNN